jgi:hypothetical protein
MQLIGPWGRYGTDIELHHAGKKTGSAGIRLLCPAVRDGLSRYRIPLADIRSGYLGNGIQAKRRGRLPGAEKNSDKVFPRSAENRGMNILFEIYVNYAYL